VDKLHLIEEANGQETNFYPKQNGKFHQEKAHYNCINRRRNSKREGC